MFKKRQSTLKNIFVQRPVLLSEYFHEREDKKVHLRRSRLRFTHLWFVLVIHFSDSKPF